MQNRYYTIDDYHISFSKDYFGPETYFSSDETDTFLRLNWNLLKIPPPSTTVK